MKEIGVEVKITKVEFTQGKPTNHFQLAEFAWERAVAIMQIAGRHDPMAVLVVDDGFMLVDIEPLYRFGEEGKEIANVVLHQLARDVKAVGVAMINEAWYRLQRPDAPTKQGRPIAECEDRIEALVVHAQMRTGSHFMIGDIVRNEDHSFREVNLKEDEGLLETRSRFDGIIAQGEA